jgi:hypothetical protein
MEDDPKERVRTQDIQRTQVKMDLVKQVSTLSSGAIVILAAFVGKIAPVPSTPVATGLDAVGSCWLRASICCLVVSLVFSIVYFWTFGLSRLWQRNNPPTRFTLAMERMTSLLLSSGFCLGIIFLGIFVIVNSK